MEDSSFHLYFQNLPTNDNLFAQAIPPGARLFQCPVAGCEKIFGNKQEKDRHMIKHTDEKPYICTFPNCDKRYQRPGALKLHLQTHNDNFQLKCLIPGCDAKFLNITELNRHLWNHLNNKTVPKPISPPIPQIPAPNPQFESFLQTSYLRTKNDLMKNVQELEELYTESHNTPDAETFTIVAKRYVGEDKEGPMLKKLLCTEADKFNLYPTSPQQQQEFIETRPIAYPEPNATSKLDDLGFAEKLLKQMTQENQAMQKLLANHMASNYQNKAFGDFSTGKGKNYF